MSLSSRRLARRALPLALPVALVAGLSVSGVEPTGSATEGIGCTATVLDRAVPMREAIADESVDNRALARRNNVSTGTLRARSTAEDNELWADPCGQAYYVDAETPDRALIDPGTDLADGTPDGGPRVQRAAGTAPLTVGSLADTFRLSSEPGAARTIYLDFRGGQVQDTGWNSSSEYGTGTTIDVEPYSLTAPASTAYTDAELAEIQKAWQVVAEDYAPFDVNVTTADPGDAALDRTGPLDEQYGSHVQITNAGPLYDACGCGGVAYIDVFALAGLDHSRYQPAWVFSAGAGTSGKNIGEAASHEAGHNLGLSHDATSTLGYYEGAAPWAPVMGAAYSQPVSQWSRGEYPDAIELQDDLSVIAASTPLRADDHGDTAATATALDGAAEGIIGTRQDQDAFTVEGAGTTTVAVSTAAGSPDLDVQLTVRDQDGSTVARMDPMVRKVSTVVAAGLGATWTGQLPAEGATYTVVVEGVGSGDPGIEGAYSDYGSLGNYRVAVATQAPSTGTDGGGGGTETTGDPTPEPPPTTTPLGLTVGTLPRGRQLEGYSAPLDGTASGGTAPYLWTVRGLPDGLSWNGSTITGTPRAAGRSTLTITVTDSVGSTASTTQALTIESPVLLSPLTFAGRAILPRARARTPYRARLFLLGGAAPRTWAPRSALPRGLRLRPNADGSRALLAGRPRKPGVYRFVLRGQDASGMATRRVYRLRVLRPRR